MTDQKMIANIFTDFRNLYTGKEPMGIFSLCEKYENHPMLMALLDNLGEAVKLQVPAAMKEIYGFYKQYRGKDLVDQDWEEIVKTAGDMVKSQQENIWYRRVVLEIVNLLDDDDRERQIIAKEVEKEMEEAQREVA